MALSTDAATAQTLPELPVFVLTGPTGAGKTDWAMRLAERAPVEIVSVDSAQVYRGLDIGTAKPTRELRARIPHHLVDICEPTESYSAGRFVRDAEECIRAIHARRRVPLLVGGTMLYLRALPTDWPSSRPPPRSFGPSSISAPHASDGPRSTQSSSNSTLTPPPASHRTMASGSNGRWRFA